MRRPSKVQRDGLGPKYARKYHGGEYQEYRVFTRKEVQEHLQLVSTSLQDGICDPRRIKRVFDKLGHTVTLPRIRRLIARVIDAWKEEDVTRTALAKAAAIRRIHRHIAQCQENGNMTALRGFEELLSKIEGTQEAIRVNVDMQVTEAMFSVVGSLSPAEMEGMLVEYQEREQLAQAYKREHPELPAASSPLNGSNGAQH